MRSELGLVLAEIDRPGALAEFRQIPTDADVFVEVQRHFVSICLESERLAEAEEALLKVNEHSPDDWWANITLAELHFRQRRVREALPFAQRANELDPEHAPGYFLTAEILDDLQRPREMVAPLKRAIELELDNYAAHVNLSYAYAEAGDAQGSLEEAKWCLARNPNDVNALRFKAIAERDLGDSQASMTTIKQALTLAPYDLESRLVEAGLLLFERRENEAFENLEPLYEKHSGDRRLAALLARAAAAAGKTQKAQQYREQVQRLSN